MKHLLSLSIARALILLTPGSLAGIAAAQTYTYPQLEHFSRRCAGAAGHFFVIPAGNLRLLASAHSIPVGEML
jgi:hypothetical protein